MNSQLEKQAPTGEEQARRQHAVRKWVVLRGVLLGVLVAAWWILFAPDAMMDAQLKTILGIIAGLVATGSYLYNLRQTLCPERCRARDDAPGSRQP